MRYLVIMVSALLLMLPGTVLSANNGQSLTETEVLERIAGTWVEDKEVTLEQIDRRLGEEGLDSETASRLHVLRRMAVESELAMHFTEDGTARVTGDIKGNRVEEHGRVKVLSVEENQADIVFEGGENFLNRELTLVFKDEGFYLIIDGLKRHYERQ